MPWESPGQEEMWSSPHLEKNMQLREAEGLGVGHTAGGAERCPHSCGPPPLDPQPGLTEVCDQ